MNPDAWLFHAINNFVGTVPLIDWLARAIVNDYAVPTAMSLVAVALWFAGATPAERTRNQRAVIFIALAAKQNATSTGMLGNDETDGR